MIRLPRRPVSLATRLSAWYAGSAFFLLVTATGFLYFVLVHSFDLEDNQYLFEKVRSLEILLRDRPPKADTVVWEIEGESSAHPSIRVLSRVLSATGNVVVETEGMSRELPRDFFPPPVTLDESAPNGIEARTANGRTFRAASVTVPGVAHEDSSRPRYTLQVAIDLTYERELLAGYRQKLWIVLGLGLLASVLVGYRMAHRGLRPVNEISKAIARTRSPVLSERVRVDGLPSELLGLAATFNELMGRLSESFGRLSRFSSDIAHELRTPLNNLMGEIDVALSKPRSPEEYQDLLGSLSEECNHLKRLVDSLLFLARAEHPETQIRRDDLDIRRELELVREFYEAAATEAGVALDLSVTHGLRFPLDRTLFQRAIGNLVQNSLAHTPQGGHVQISANGVPNTLTVSVADDGVGIGSEHLSKVFDRFYRVDPARAKDTGGVGLGLAIVQSIARLHGGNVEIKSEAGRGTVVTLSFSTESPETPALQSQGATAYS